MRRKTIKVQFRHFWAGFDPHRRFGFLEDRYHLELSEDPDYIIYSCFSPDGPPWRQPDVNSGACRIFYTGENLRPDMSRCDYAFSFCYEDDLRSKRHFRLPNYTLRLWEFGYSAEDLLRPIPTGEDALARRDRFCAFLYRNPRADMRNDLFDLLHAMEPVDAPGPAKKNCDAEIGPFSEGPRAKERFLSRYRFSFAFENMSAPGYTTEKLVEARLAGTIPIYWGNPFVHRDFNPRSFISFYDHGCSLQGLRDRVLQVHRDAGLYRATLEEPFFRGGIPSRALDRFAVLDDFGQVFG